MRNLEPFCFTNPISKMKLPSFLFGVLSLLANFLLLFPLLEQFFKLILYAGADTKLKLLTYKDEKGPTIEVSMQNGSPIRSH